MLQSPYGGKAGNRNCQPHSTKGRELTVGPANFSEHGSPQQVGTAKLTSVVGPSHRKAHLQPLRRHHTTPTIATSALSTCHSALSPLHALLL